MTNLRLFSITASLALAALPMAGCVSTQPTRMLAPARPALANAAAVRVYEEAPRHFQEIALIEGRSIPELQSKAASVGANGILPNGVVRKPGPLIGIGVGGSSYHVGRRSAVGIDSGASFAIPTGSDVMQATAIYVR